MAITTVEPGKNEEIDPADAAEATVSEDLQWRSPDLEAMFGTRLSDEALGFDEETFDVQVSDEESLERDGGDFTEHAFAAVHTGQRSLLAARGGGNVNDANETVHGDPNAPKDPYKNAMLMSALYSGTAQQIALRNAMEQADAVRRSMENAAAAKAQYEALEQARAEAEARGDTAAVAAIEEDLDVAAEAVVVEADRVQTEMDQMGRSIDSMAIEIATTRALNEGTLDEARANAAREEIREAGASGFVDRDALSEDARIIYDEAQPISMEMRGRIQYAIENGGEVDLEGLDPDVAAQTQAIADRFEGMIHGAEAMPANRLTNCGPEDETVVAAQERLGLDRGGLLGSLSLDGTPPLPPTSRPSWKTAPK